MRTSGDRAERTRSSSPPDVSVIALVAHARHVPSIDREPFASRLAAIPEGPGHIAVRTCHRAELYVTPAAFQGQLPELPPGARRLEDAAAARHLIAVACGMDSAVFGETQILHQLRETVAERQGDRALDPILDRLFQAALHAGRTAHAWFSGSPRSLSDVALDRIAARIAPGGPAEQLLEAGRAAGVGRTAEERQLAGRRILVVGVGRMGRLAAFAAQRRGASLLVANRTPERASALAAEVNGETLAFTLDEPLPQIDGVVVAVAGRWSLGSQQIAALVDRGIPVVDLSSPPAVPPQLQLDLGDRFVSVDDLATGDGAPGAKLRQRLEKLVSESGLEYCQWIRSREAVPAIQAVVATAEQHRQAELEWLARRMPGLGPEDMGLVEQMSHRLVAAILHAPLTALNGDSTGDLEHAARELFNV